MTDQRLPTYFLSHGAGPWSYMHGDFRERFAALEHSLVAMRNELGDAPKAVLMISAHWEENGFAISSAAQPGMIYDYHGFPDYTYDVHYRAPGSPELAHRVERLLRDGGMLAWLDAERGYDHGTFGVLKPLYPAENMPVVQLSLNRNLDSGLHIEVGRLLAPLRSEGILIIGSGQSFQNLALRDARARVPSAEFDAWLQQTLLQSSPGERRARLLHWEQAPYARLAHAREEHLIPLMVAVGAAEDEAGSCIYREQLFGLMTAASFRFGPLPLAGQRVDR